MEDKPIFTKSIIAMANIRNDKGFTLLELMIVLAIVGILLVVAGPSLQTMSADSLASKVGAMFEMDVKFARNTAITRGETVRMSPRNGDIANGWVIMAETSNDLIRQRGELDDRVSISSDSGLATIAFTATGQAESAGTVTIRTDGCVGDEDTLITLLTSGQVAVRKLTCVQ